MIKQNKGKIILSSAIILLPTLFGLIVWNKMPNTITAGGVLGNENGFSGKAFIVFGLPVLLLAGHLICLFFTFLDQKQKDQSKKALGTVFWIIPFISLMTSGITYAVAFGKTISYEMIFSVILGAMFIFIGNYLPKTKQNRTLGIRIGWTLNNEENWNKTHRFGGKVWVVGGLILMLSIFLPSSAMAPVFVEVTLSIIIIPIVYSYCIYKKHKKQGIAYVALPKSKSEKIASKIAAIIVPLILIGAAVLMFTGNIKVECGDTSFKINADYWEDAKIDYSQIDNISYCEDFDKGVRVFGFGSPRLLMGSFQNDELGTYTLYSYANAEEVILITLGEKTLVIGMNEPKETQKIYNTILEKTNG